LHLGVIALNSYRLPPAAFETSGRTGGGGLKCDFQLANWAGAPKFQP